MEWDTEIFSIISLNLLTSGTKQWNFDTAQLSHTIRLKCYVL